MSYSQFAKLEKELARVDKTTNNAVYGIGELLIAGKLIIQGFNINESIQNSTTIRFSTAWHANSKIQGDLTIFFTLSTIKSTFYIM